MAVTEILENGNLHLSVNLFFTDYHGHCPVTRANAGPPQPRLILFWTPQRAILAAFWARAMRTRAAGNPRSPPR